MTDPFESLRRPVGGTSSTPSSIDPRFRAELLAEARRRLASVEPVSVRERDEADTPTILTEDTLMANIKFFNRRSFLVAAACVVLVAAGVIAIAALRGDDTPPPAAADQPGSAVPATAAPATTAPATTAPATAAPATTAPATTQPTTPPTTVPEPAPPVPVAFATFNQETQQIGDVRDGLTRTQEHAEVRGDLQGSLTGATISTEGALTTLAWFEGTIGSCGTGGVTLAIATTDDGMTRWELVPTLATGDGIHASGSGTVVSSDFTGSLTCDGADEWAGTTLIQPPRAEGEPLELPDATLTTEVEHFTVPADPTHTTPADVTVYAAVNSGDELDFVQVTTADRGYYKESVQNVMLGITNGEVCGQPGVLRVMITNLLYPNNDGGSDVVSARSSGAEGGTDGVVCP
jgi:hypothetical protein